MIRFGVCTSNFRDKLCTGITDEESTIVKDAKCIINRALIRKIWVNCLEYEYISKSYNFMGFLIDRIVLR